MPIGKNSIKRVQNSGYSNVKTTAPDMENSTVLSNPSPEVIKVFVSDKNDKKVKESKQKLTNKAETSAKLSKSAPSKSAKNAAAIADAKSTAATERKDESVSEKRGKASSQKRMSAAVTNKKTSPAAAPKETVCSYVNLGKPLPPHLL